MNEWAIVALILNGLIALVIALQMFVLKGQAAQIKTLFVEVGKSAETLRVDMKEGFSKVSADAEKLQTKEICAIYRAAEKAELDAAKHDVNQIGRKLDSRIGKGGA